MLPSLEHGMWNDGRYSFSSSTSILSVSTLRTSARAWSAVCRNWFAPFEKSVTVKGDEAPEPCRREWCWKWKSVLRRRERRQFLRRLETLLDNDG